MSKKKKNLPAFFQFLGGIFTNLILVLLFLVENPIRSSQAFWANWELILLLFFSLWWVATFFVVKPFIAKSSTQKDAVNKGSGAIALLVAAFSTLLIYSYTNDLRHHYLMSSRYNSLNLIERDSLEVMYTDEDSVVFVEDSDDSLRVEVISGDFPEQPTKVIDSLDFKFSLVEGFSSHIYSFDTSSKTLKIEPDPSFEVKASRLGPIDQDEESEFKRIYNLIRDRYSQPGINENSLYETVMDPDIRYLVRAYYKTLKPLRIKEIEKVTEVYSTSIEKLETYMSWEVNYLGQWIPKIRISCIVPESLMGLVVYDVYYYVESFTYLSETFQNKGGGDSKIYSFNLSPKPGRQTLPLHSNSLNVTRSKEDYLNLEFVIKPDARKHYSGRWKGKVFLHTSEGDLFVGNLDLSTYTDSRPFFFKKSL